MYSIKIIVNCYDITIYQMIGIIKQYSLYQLMLQQPIYSFAGGPTMLPRYIIKKAQQTFLSYENTGVSTFELDPDSKQFIEIHTRAKELVRGLLHVPEKYKIWFCPAGAHLQFGAFPMNLLRNKKTANYTKTGHFSKLSVEEAQKVCHVNVIATTQKDQNNKSYVPYQDYKIDSDASFIHYVDNETVEGIEYTEKTMPYFEGQYLLNDCSSNFLTRWIDWSKCSLAYAHTQKNCGISGSTIMIIDEQLTKLPKLPNTPYVCNYDNYSKGYPSTEMTYPIYLNYLMLQYVKDSGGVDYFSYNSEQRCKKLYEILDSSHGFYDSQVRKDWRSRINVTWKMTSDIEAKCLSEAAQNGLFEIKGHRAVGGFRASLFTPMPNEGVDKLADFLKDFMVKYQ